jgi:hypothetical protein
MKLSVRGSGAPARGASDLVAIALLVAASAVHLLLSPEHFAESVVFGVAFTGIAAFQLGLAAALWARPADTVRTIGRWGSLAIVAVYLGARVFVPPGGTTVEDVEWRGVLSVVLELSTVAALALGPPIRARRPSPMPAVATGVAFILLTLIAGGDLAYAASPFGEPGVKAFFYGGGPNGQLAVGALSPAVGIHLAQHWSLYLPVPSALLTVLVGALLGYAVHLTIRISALWQAARARFGLLGAAPAVLAAPVCCGPSLLSIAGIGAAAAVAPLALLLLALSGVLLAANVVWQRRVRRGCARPGVRPGPTGVESH